MQINIDIISSAEADYRRRSAVGEAVQRGGAVIQEAVSWTEKTLRSSVKEMASDKYQSAAMKT